MELLINWMDLMIPHGGAIRVTEEFKREFNSLKRKLLERTFSNLNKNQLEAVFNVNGPMVVLAGAGSGKTTAVISRIVNMINYGNAYMSSEVPEGINEEALIRLRKAYEEGLDARYVREIIKVDAVNPENILSITFTNKAAGELKTRLNDALGNIAKDVCSSTFHSLCSRILRENADKLGYSNHFVVYDEEDSVKVIKECLKSLRLDDKLMTPKNIKYEISRAKDKLMDPLEYKCHSESDFRLSGVADIYDFYQKKLADADAMDFDDLIVNTVKLFKNFPDVLQRYQEKFKYILVDEYQDTNYAQCVLIKSLVGKTHNLCVVGDDDQSIYKFRGATIDNIIDFDKHFPNAKVVRFEQNYRSTKNIINAANSVISNNTKRKGKTLWTQNEDGDLIKIHTAYSEHDEAHYIAETIQNRVSKGEKYSDFAILYRMNSQSNVIERVLMRREIMYRVFGGVRFYDRKEVKDMLAYLSVINNPRDEIRLKRIINQPRRSIGERTIAQVAEISKEENKDLLTVIRECEGYSSLQRVSMKLKSFSNLIDDLVYAYNSEGMSLHELYELVLEKTDYINYLKLDKDNSESRIENVKELLSSILQYEEEKGDDATLSGFLEEVSLFSDVDNYDSESDAVVLMTLHAAKGLEFPNVFLPGFEEGIFPGMQVLENESEVEEERRLAYVGITRCRKSLYILNSDSRMLFGTTSHNKASRFLSEIPETLVQKSKSRDWKVLKSGERIPKSAQELRNQSIMAAHHFGGIAGGRSMGNSMPSPGLFQNGDKVCHGIFGDGVITSAMNMGNDTMLTIDFGDLGFKKLMANYAKLEKK